MYANIYIHIYIWQHLNKSVPWTVLLENAFKQSDLLQESPGRKAPAAAIKTNKKHINMIWP